MLLQKMKMGRQDRLHAYKGTCLLVLLLLGQQRCGNMYNMQPRIVIPEITSWSWTLGCLLDRNPH